MDKYIDTQFELMKVLDINAEEFMLIECLLYALDEDEPDYYYITTYFNEIKKSSIPRETLINLKGKGVLDTKCVIPEAGQPLKLTDIVFSKTFLQKYFVTSGEAGAELFENYPSFIKASYGDLPAKNITKGGYQSLEAFFVAYRKAIRSSRKNHKKVMECLRFAKENGLLTYGIVEYVVGRKWLEHEKIMNGNTDEFVPTYDPIESK